MSTPKEPSNQHWWGGMYAAILPSSPDVTVEQLWDAALCTTTGCRPPQPKEANGDGNDGDDASPADEAAVVEWRFHRTCSLVHPQLSHPLLYLEVSGLVRHPDDCDRVLEALMREHPIVVGNAELLLTVEGTEIPLLSVDLPMDGSIDSLMNCGVVAIPGAVPVDHTDLLDEVLEHSTHLFQALYERLATMGENSSNRSSKHRYREIMARDPKRYDFRLDGPSRGGGDGAVGEALGPSNDYADDHVPCWERLEQHGRWMALIKEALGDDAVRIKCGCVLSLPGAQHQYWHSDGVHVGPALSLPKSVVEEASDNLDDVEEVNPPHALCVFVPLIALTDETGGTEFWAGSHRYDQLLKEQGEASVPGGTMGIVERGDAVVYDYRVVHRGMANRSNASRPIAYYLYVKPGYEQVEDQNFTRRSVWDDSD